MAGLVLFFILMGLTGCSGEKEDQAESPSLPTRGELVIGIDESLKPFADAEIAMFSADYPDARITPLYLPEKQVVEKLLTNEIQTAILCRNLAPDETDLLTGNYAHSARSFKLADDKIVAVVNKDNPVNAISYQQLKDILSGNISDWTSLEGASFPDSQAAQPPSRQASLTVVITGASSIDRFFTSSDPLPRMSAYALETTTEVIDYVRDNPSAMGILGGSWFFQKGSGYSDVKVLTYSEDESTVDGHSEKPSREVYAVTHEPVTGLGSGFISFMASRKGQLILSKAGMTPYKSIERQIQLRNSFKE